MHPGISTGPYESLPVSGSDGPTGGPALRIDTDLSVTVAGHPVSVASTGDRVFVDTPSLTAARTVAAGANRARLRELSRALSVVGVTAEFRVAGRSVLVLGDAAQPGVLAERLGVAPAEVRASSALAVFWREVLALVRGPGASW